MNENNNPIEITESSSSLETPSDISQKNSLSVSHTGFTNLAVSELLMAVAIIIPLSMNAVHFKVSNPESESTAVTAFFILVPTVLLLGLFIASAVFAFRGFRQLGTVYSDFNRLKKIYLVSFFINLAITCFFNPSCNFFFPFANTLVFVLIYVLLQFLFFILQGVCFYRIYTYTSQCLRNSGYRFYIKGCHRLRTAYIVYEFIIFLFPALILIIMLVEGDYFNLKDDLLEQIFYNGCVSSESIIFPSLQQELSGVNNIAGIAVYFAYLMFIVFVILTRLYYATLRFLSYVKLKNIASVDIKNETGENANC